jgi:hypothetical protein
LDGAARNEEIGVSFVDPVEVALTPDEARALLEAADFPIGNPLVRGNGELLRSAVEKLRIGLVEIGEAP